MSVFDSGYVVGPRSHHQIQLSGVSERKANAPAREARRTTQTAAEPVNYRRAGACSGERKTKSHDAVNVNDVNVE